MNNLNNKNDNYINEDLEKALNVDLEINSIKTKSYKNNYQKTLMSENEVCKSCNDLLNEKLWVTRGINSPKKYCLSCSQKYTKNCIIFGIIFGIILFLIALTPLLIIWSH